MNWLNPEETVKRKTENTVSKEIDDEIQSSLAYLGIKLSKTLISEIKEKPKKQVMSAILVVQETLDAGVKVRSKVGLFRSALQAEWVLNEKDEERRINQEQEELPE